MAALADRPGDGQRDRPRRRLARRGRPRRRAAAAQEFFAVDPAGRAPRAADRAARPLQRRELSARGGAAGRGRGVTRTGRARAARRAGARPAGAGRPRAGLPGAGRLRAQAGGAARRAGDAARADHRPASRWCSAPAATGTRASASRWAGWPPSWPTWWSSPTTTRATRIPPRSAPRSSPGRRGGPAQVVEIGDRREAIDHAVGWARAGDVVLIAGKGHEAGQTSHGQTRPFDDRDELAGSLEALGSRA